MRSFRSFVLSAVIAFSVIAASIQPARAFLPVWVGAVAYDTLVATASSVSIGVLARGFAANDPYVKTVATIPRARLASNMSRYLRGAPWVGLAVLAAAIAYPYDEEIGFYKEVKNWPQYGYCQGNPSAKSLDACGMAWFTQNYSNCIASGWAWPCVQPATPYDVVPRGLQTSMCAPSEGIPAPCYLYQIYVRGGPTNYMSKSDSTSQKQPLSVAEYDTAINRIAASPKTMGDMFAGADPAMLNNLLDGATIPYEATKPTPQLAELMKQYRQGLLQSSDPNKPYYVDPDMMAKIQALVAKEDALNTDDGKLDALNKSIEQPITQAQYEASNLKYADAVNSVTDSVSSKNDFSDIDDHFKKLDDFVTDIPNTSLPSAASVNFPKYSSCRQLHLTDGKGHELAFPSESQCAKLEDVKQGFGYFLYLLCAFGLVWQLLTRPTGA